LDASGPGFMTPLPERQQEDGTRLPVLLDITVLKDSDGVPLSRVMVALDLSERKRIEAQVRDLNADLERRVRVDIEPDPRYQLVAVLRQRDRAPVLEAGAGDQGEALLDRCEELLAADDLRVLSLARQSIGLLRALLGPVAAEFESHLEGFDFPEALRLLRNSRGRAVAVS